MTTYSRSENNIVYVLNDAIIAVTVAIFKGIFHLVLFVFRNGVIRPGELAAAKMASQLGPPQELIPEPPLKHALPRPATARVRRRKSPLNKGASERKKPVRRTKKRTKAVAKPASSDFLNTYIEKAGCTRQELYDKFWKLHKFPPEFVENNIIHANGWA